MKPTGLDYASAFQLAPIGLAISQERLICDCNERLLQIFGATRAQLIGQSFALLYPSTAEFERMGQRISASLDAHGHYADERVMRRLGPSEPGQADTLFWCHVSGRALDPAHPHAHGIWGFEDLSARRPLRVALTAREREVAALLVQGLSSKHIGRQLNVSPRTVDIYRTRLMKKYSVSSSPELMSKLLS